MADAEHDALLDGLRALTDAPNGAEFTRSNVIALLGVLVTHLGEALATKVGGTRGRSVRRSGASSVRAVVWTG